MTTAHHTVESLLRLLRYWSDRLRRRRSHRAGQLKFSLLIWWGRATNLCRKFRVATLRTAKDALRDNKGDCVLRQRRIRRRAARQAGPWFSWRGDRSG